MSTPSVDSDMSALTRSLEALTLKNHTSSPLLRLPAELRNKIYASVFTVPWLFVCGTDACSSCKRSRRYLTQPYKIHFSGSLTLSATCRQLYAGKKALPFHLNGIYGRASDVHKALQRLEAWQRKPVTRLSIKMNDNLITSGDSDDDIEDYLALERPAFDSLLRKLGELQGLTRLAVDWTPACAIREAVKEFKEPLAREWAGFLGNVGVELEVEITARYFGLPDGWDDGKVDGR